MGAADDQPAVPVLDVSEALVRMQEAVRSGRIDEARAIGGAAAVPLNVSMADVALGARLSEGAEAMVYCGVFCGSDVAIKRFRIGTSQDLLRFRQELRVLASLRHPNIVSVVAARCLPPDYALVMPLEGRSLRHRLYDDGWRPDWPAVLAIASQLASALAHVHAAGILHRDIKPANLLTPSAPAQPPAPAPAGNGPAAAAPAVKLADFGICAHVGDLEADVDDAASVSCRGKPSGGLHKRRMVGTLEYMAPEVLMKQPHSVASDVYAFAVSDSFANTVASDDIFHFFMMPPFRPAPEALLSP